MLSLFCHKEGQLEAKGKKTSSVISDLTSGFRVFTLTKIIVIPLVKTESRIFFIFAKNTLGSVKTRMEARISRNSSLIFCIVWRRTHYKQQYLLPQDSALINTPIISTQANLDCVYIWRKIKVNVGEDVAAQQRGEGEKRVSRPGCHGAGKDGTADARTRGLCQAEIRAVTVGDHDGQCKDVEDCVIGEWLCLRIFSEKKNFHLH